MGAAQRLTAALLLVLLAGCSSQTEQQMQAQIAQQQAQIQQLQAQVRAYTDASERLDAAASVYNGCMALWGLGAGLCPADSLALGREAAAAGFPGAGWPYWLALIGKLAAAAAAAGAGVGALLAGGGWAWARIAAPEAARTRRAREDIAQAQERAARAAQEAQQAEARAAAATAAAEAAVRAAEKRRAALEATTQDLELEIAALQGQIAELKAEQKLLRGFDGL